MPGSRTSHQRLARARRSELDRSDTVVKRILLIGLRRWGLDHLRVLKSMPVELFVSDLEPDRLNSCEVAPNRRSKLADLKMRALQYDLKQSLK